MRSLLVPATLVVAVLALPSSPAQAAAATCHGLTAGIEASTGEVVGTSGADVIVVSGSVTRVEAGDGDDVICLVGTHRKVRVFAGAGQDIVDTEGARAATSTDLGAGYDHFLGGSRPDHVESSGPATPDVVITRGGDDSAVITSPAFLDLGNGDDSLVLLAQPDVDSYLNLGTGDDTIRVASPGRVVVDLRLHVLRVNRARDRLQHAENVDALGEHVLIRGDGDRNTFTAAGCRVDLYGSGGDDRLSQVARGDDGSASCSGRRARLFGGPGNDTMRGSSGNDVLMGGPGRDTAYGAGGTDWCVAEKRLTCER